MDIHGRGVHIREGLVTDGLFVARGPGVSPSRQLLADRMEWPIGDFGRAVQARTVQMVHDRRIAGQSRQARMRPCRGEDVFAVGTPEMHTRQRLRAIKVGAENS